MSSADKEKVFANDLREGTAVLINGKPEKIIRIIPMQIKNKDGSLSNILDIEFLIDKKLNRYFSYNNYLKNDSWVKEIILID